jgi:hypothetical protein
LGDRAERTESIGSASAGSIVGTGPNFSGAERTRGDISRAGG